MIGIAVSGGPDRYACVLCNTRHAVVGGDRLLRYFYWVFISHVCVFCVVFLYSIALCLMAAEWAKQNNVEVIALTVNHGLRQGGYKHQNIIGIIIITVCCACI